MCMDIEQLNWAGKNCNSQIRKGNLEEKVKQNLFYLQNLWNYHTHTQKNLIEEEVKHLRNLSGHFGIAHSKLTSDFIYLLLFASQLNSFSMPTLAGCCLPRCHCWELEPGGGMCWRMSFLGLFTFLGLYWVLALPYALSCPWLWVQKKDLHIYGSWFREKSLFWKSLYPKPNQFSVEFS